MCQSRSQASSSEISEYRNRTGSFSKIVDLPDALALDLGDELGPDLVVVAAVLVEAAGLAGAS